MIGALLTALAVFLIATFPATWLLMLFLGNVNLNLSYWGTLPVGILVSLLLAGSSAGSRSHRVPAPRRVPTPGRDGVRAENALRTPRAAAVAGIVFSVLLVLSLAAAPGVRPNQPAGPAG